MSESQASDPSDPLTAYVERARPSPADTRSRNHPRRAAPRYVFRDWAFI